MKPDNTAIVEQCMAEVPPAHVLLPDPQKIDAARLLLWWPVPPAHGRDLLVRLRLGPPAALWEQLARDPGELVHVYEATGSRPAVRTLAALLLTWGLLGHEIIRRFERAPIGSVYKHVDEFGTPGLGALVQRLHARPLKGEETQDATARAFVALARLAEKAPAPPARLDACPFRAAGPAPAGWEEANQWQLDEDQRRVFAEHYAVLAGEFDKGAMHERRLGPYAVRGAQRDARRALDARKRREPPTVRIVSDAVSDAELAGAIREGELPDLETPEPAVTDPAASYLAGLSGAQATAARRVIEALVATGGNKAEAARRAEVSRQTVHDTIRRLRARRPPTD